MLEEKITALKKELVEFSALVENMLKDSVDGLINKDAELLKKVIEEDEPKANAFEIKIDDLCITLIAQFEPRAVDLRTITMILKMNNDLERMGDHAVNISKNSLRLIEKPPVKPFIDLPRMAEETIAMVNDGIEAFINSDAQLAKSVCERDNKVDSLNDQLIRELVTYMVSDSTTIHRAIRLINVSRNLERVADLATNICEDVIFMVEGKVIKHHAAEKAEDEEREEAEEK
jgi:phosphate transport system protein